MPLYLLSNNIQEDFFSYIPHPTHILYYNHSFISARWIGGMLFFCISLATNEIKHFSCCLLVFLPL